MKNNKYVRTESKIDYLKVISNVSFLDIKKNDHVDIVRQSANELGLSEKTLRNGYLFTSDIGIRLYFGEHQIHKNSTYLELDLTGTFCSLVEDEWEEARKIVKKIFLENAFLPKITRIDIRYDCKSKSNYCENPFNTFPRVDDPTKIRMKLRGRKEKENEATYKMAKYYNDVNLKKLTGFVIRRSSWQISSYNRKLNLQQKYKKGKISQEYYDHFKKEYSGYKAVQRIELRLKSNQTGMANILFFNKTKKYKTKKKCIRKILAHFSMNHMIFEKRKNGEWVQNDMYREAFCLSGYTPIKEVREELSCVGLNVFKTAKVEIRDISYYINQLAKKVVEMKIHHTDFDFFILNSLKEAVTEKEQEKITKENNFLATINFLGFSSEEKLNEIRDSIKNRKRIVDKMKKEVNEASIKLRQEIDYESLLMEM